MAARRMAATTGRVSTDLPAPLLADLEAELPARVLADLQTGDAGLSSREAARRLIAAGPNELESRAAPHLAARSRGAVHASARAAAVRGGAAGVRRRDRRPRLGRSSR